MRCPGRRDGPAIVTEPVRGGEFLIRLVDDHHDDDPRTFRRRSAHEAAVVFRLAIAGLSLADVRCAGLAENVRRLAARL